MWGINPLLCDILIELEIRLEGTSYKSDVIGCMLRNMRHHTQKIYNRVIDALSEEEIKSDSEDMDSLLDETMKSFKDNFSRDLDRVEQLKKETSENNLEYTHSHLRELRAAYESKDINQLINIGEVCERGKEGNESISYSERLFNYFDGLGYDFPFPFDNETMGTKPAYRPIGCASLLEEIKGTGFMQYIQRKYGEFTRLADRTTLEILFSDNYKQAVERAYKLPETEDWSKKAIEILLQPYLGEELRRVDCILDLCARSDELFTLVERLYRRVNTYVTSLPA